MSSDRYEGRMMGPIPLDYAPRRKVRPPYLNADGTSILRVRPDHAATVDHLVTHGYNRRDLVDADLELWHGMAHDVPVIEKAIKAVHQLYEGVRPLQILDLLDLLGEAKEENDRLRGIIQSTIDFHREEE